VSISHLFCTNLNISQLPK